MLALSLQVLCGDVDINKVLFMDCAVLGSISIKDNS